MPYSWYLRSFSNPLIKNPPLLIFGGAHKDIMGFIIAIAVRILPYFNSASQKNFGPGLDLFYESRHKSMTFIKEETFQAKNL
jgi:hypothetical protein